MNSLLDDVNELMKLNYGNSIRLTHLKKILESGKILYSSDRTYIEKLVEDHLVYESEKRFQKTNSYDYPEFANRIIDKSMSKPKYTAKIVNETEPEHTDEIVSKSEPKKEEYSESLFCGYCGNAIKNVNFCPKCGHSLNSVSSKNEYNETKLKESKLEEKTSSQKNKGTANGGKILIGLGVLFAVIVIGVMTIGDVNIGNIGIGVNDNQKFKEELFEGLTASQKSAYSLQLNICKNNTEYIQSEKAGKLYEERCVESTTLDFISTIPDLKCGAGTVFDESSRSCILD